MPHRRSRSAPRPRGRPLGAGSDARRTITSWPPSTSRTSPDRVGARGPGARPRSSIATRHCRQRELVRLSLPRLPGRRAPHAPPLVGVGPSPGARIGRGRAASGRFVLVLVLLAEEEIGGPRPPCRGNGIGLEVGVVGGGDEVVGLGVAEAGLAEVLLVRDAGSRACERGYPAGCSGRIPPPPWPAPSSPARCRAPPSTACGRPGHDVRVWPGELPPTPGELRALAAGRGGGG